MNSVNSLINHYQKYQDGDACAFNKAIAPRAANLFLVAPTEVAAVAQNILRLPLFAATTAVKTMVQVVSKISGSKAVKEFGNKLPGCSALIRTTARIVLYALGSVLSATVGVISPAANFKAHCALGLAIDNRKKQVEADLDEETVEAEETVVIEDETVVPKKETVVIEDETVVPKEETVVPKEETVVPKEETVVPKEETVVPKEETVASPDNKVCVLFDEEEPQTPPRSSEETVEANAAKETADEARKDIVTDTPVTIEEPRISCHKKAGKTAVKALSATFNRIKNTTSGFSKTAKITIVSGVVVGVVGIVAFIAKNHWNAPAVNGF